MTRPTDASTARAFWAAVRMIDKYELHTDLQFSGDVIERAAEFDAESPAGTARGSEEVEQPYWLCCGSKILTSHKSGCIEAARGYPEHCRWGTKSEHSASQRPYDHCSKCTAHMPPGKCCDGPNCPLRK